MPCIDVDLDQGKEIERKAEPISNRKKNPNPNPNPKDRGPT
jgi:hypothetical protein